MLQNKIKQAKQRIANVINANTINNIFIGHSGGKDSVAVHNLTLEVLSDAKLSNNLTLIHNPKNIYDKAKTNEAPGQTDVYNETLEFLYNTVSEYANITIVNPKNMLSFVNAKGLTLQIDGTRADENERVTKSSNLVLNGKEENRQFMTEHNQKGLYNLEFLYPIFDWSTNDVFSYLELRNIEISPEYQNDDDYKKFKKQKTLK